MAEPLWRLLLKSVIETEEYEISCQECYNLLDQYADLLIEGADPAEIMPLVKTHLVHCPDCTDLFDTLVTILHGTSSTSFTQLTAE